jgi:hypothetical protein
MYNDTNISGSAIMLRGGCRCWLVMRLYCPSMLMFVELIAVGSASGTKRMNAP